MSGILLNVLGNPIVAGGLFNFTTFTFTNAGQTGPIGPSSAQCTSAYSGASFLPSYFSVTNGYQSLFVPKTGTYEFELIGAPGGMAGTAPSGRAMGAKVVGRFNLTEGSVITFVIGQGGGNSNTTNNNPGGGGGTFVTLGTYANVVAAADQLLFAAGGAGGGHSAGTNNYLDAVGQTTELGKATASGAINGVGQGAAGSGNTNSVGGAGYLTNSNNDITSRFGGTPTTNATSSTAFRLGSIGGGAADGNYFGGFGGGGMGSSQQSADQDKGGGGGYSGGGYAFDADAYGGGAGSYSIASATNVVKTRGDSVSIQSHGSFKLTYIG